MHQPVSRVMGGPEAAPVAVRYGLSYRGFFSEFNILAYAYADCLAQGRRLFLDPWKSSTPWRELFSNFPPGVEALDPRAYANIIDLYPKAKDRAWQAMRRRVRDACLERRVISVAELDFEGTFDQLVFRAAGELFTPRESLRAEAAAAIRGLGLDQAPFCAVQIRRGDKTEGYVNNGELVVEAAASSFEVYADCIGRLAPDVRDVFVLTDDYGAFEEARASHPQYRFHTLCTPEERGYFHVDHLARPPQEALKDVRKLIVTVMLARTSQAFVGTYWSNLSTAVCMLHANRARCASIDLSQDWPSLDPLFLPGRDSLGVR